MKIEKNNMRNILIFIDNDVCFRHFIMNSTFKDVCLNNNVKFVFPEENNKRIDNIVFEKKYFNSDVVRLHQDKTRVRTWKYLLYINQLRWRFGQQNKIIRKQRKFNLGWKAYYLFKCMGLPIIWNVYKFFKLKFIITNKYQDLERLIIEFKPDIFIHPSTLDSLYINDLIYYGKKKSIKTFVLMNSWDNPSTKNTVFDYPDALLVWGEQTKSHAVQFMKIPNKKVNIFGAAQFEIFKSKSIKNKKEFKSQYKINNEKIILYAGSSKGTNELMHLDILDKAIQDGKIINTKIIYRPHPWGGGGANGEKILEQKWKNIFIEQEFIQYLQNIANGINKKFLSDYVNTHCTLSNIDYVISPLSTIIIEAAMHGKSSLCFLPKEPNAKHMNIEVDLIHFQDIFNNDLVYKANTNIDLINTVNRMLNDDNLNKQKELIEFSRYFIKDFKKSYSERLNELICKLE